MASGGQAAGDGRHPGRAQTGAAADARERSAVRAANVPHKTTNDLRCDLQQSLRSVVVDLAKLVATGYGDIPLIRLRSSACRSRDVSAVVSGARHAGY